MDAVLFEVGAGQGVAWSVSKVRDEIADTSTWKVNNFSFILNSMLQ
jgi:hypothetical protein